MPPDFTCAIAVREPALTFDHRMRRSFASRRTRLFATRCHDTRLTAIKSRDARRCAATTARANLLQRVWAHKKYIFARQTNSFRAKAIHLPARCSAQRLASVSPQKHLRCQKMRLVAARHCHRCYWSCSGTWAGLESELWHSPKLS